MCRIEWMWYKELEGSSTVIAASLHPSLEMTAASLTGTGIGSSHTDDTCSIECPSY